ncbi:MAG: hypothetical protein FWG14_12715 [Peptococcaceae bacterium]|nr:hypothetical protein [Peptococcaceae bacterium]
MLTQERADKLSEVLCADEERARTFLELKPAEALSQINALGNDFTLDEIEEFGQMARDLNAQRELDADALDNVAGGGLPAIIGAGIAYCKFWYKVGYDKEKSRQGK